MFIVKAGLVETQEGLLKLLTAYGIHPDDLAFTLDFFVTRDPEVLKASVEKLWDIVDQHNISHESAEIAIQKIEKSREKTHKQFHKPFYEIHFSSPSEQQLAVDVLNYDSKFRRLLKDQPSDYLKFDDEDTANEVLKELKSYSYNVTLK